MTAVINEFFFNNAGADTLEYIEVLVPDGTDTAGLYVLQVEGDVAANTTQRGRIDGVYAVPTPTGGYSLIPVNPGQAGTLENGAFTLLLVRSEVAPGVATADDGTNDFDRNNDGALDAGFPYQIIDAVGIADDAADSTYAGGVRLTNIPSGANAVGGFSRIPDGADTDDNADWTPNDQALDPDDDLDPTPDAGEARNTPGAANQPEVEVLPGIAVRIFGNDFVLDLAEGAPGVAFEVFLNTQPTADVTVAITPDAQVTIDLSSLTFTPDNWDIPQQVLVTAIDDTAAEGLHQATVAIGNAVSLDPDYEGYPVPAVPVSITDNDAVGPVLTEISAIQGAGHTSLLVGQQVTTSGIVTARSNNGFWMQDPTPDPDIATSEGIFVFTGSAPAVAVGDAVQVAGTVTEFTRTTSSPGHLSITQLTAPTVSVISSGNALPDAVVIGADRTPPSENTDDDGFTSFDPVLDGVDFWESLEGMRVTLPDAMAVSPSFNSTSTAAVNANKAETFAVANRGAQATGLNDAGGLTLSETDDNPERVAVQANQQVLPGADFVTKPGDLLGDVVGVLDYDNRGNFEIILTQAITVVDGGLEKEGPTDLAGDADSLTVGTYNVENLAGTTSAAKFTALGIDIAQLMRSPDIIALQEIQDNNGATNNGVVDASETYGKLIAAITAAGGPTYTFLNIDPVNNTSGGAPGGNIRVGFLYNDARVDLVGGSLRQVDPANTAAWEASRIPLAADFLFNGEVITVVNNHWASKGGSSPQFGTIQPLLNGSEDQRVLQAAAVKAFVDDILADDADANIIVMGDLNEFPWEDSLDIVTGVAAGEPVLFDLLELSEPDPTERYEYVFDGNHQILDHMLASGSLVQRGFAFDSLQVNSQFPSAQRNSDHDPAVARFTIPALATLDFSLWQTATNSTNGVAGWSDPARNLDYTNASGIEQQSWRLADDTGGSLARFRNTDGDVAIREVDFASGLAVGGGAISLDWTGRDAVLSLDLAWNAIKNVYLNGFDGGSLAVQNFVAVAYNFLAQSDDIDLLIQGASRVNGRSGAGDDRIVVEADSDGGPVGENRIRLQTGEGDDQVEIRASAFDWSGSFSPAAYDPLWTQGVVELGAGDDTFLGGAGQDIVTGGAGDDVLDGRGGFDQAIFAGSRAAYTVSIDSGVTTVAGFGDTDTLTGFEQLRFDDAVLNLRGGIWV
jgi:predicted extracellular nuclease